LPFLGVAIRRAAVSAAHRGRVSHHPGWTVAQPFDGVLVWRSPHGRHYLVDHTGTTKATTAA